jgi:hypothetical protein
VADAAAVGDREVVAVEGQVRLGAQPVAHFDQVFIGRADQRQRVLVARLVAGRLPASKSRSHSASGLETMSLPPPENSISSHGVPAPGSNTDRQQHPYIE